jgi:hypothetical protein
VTGERAGQHQHPITGLEPRRELDQPIDLAIAYLHDGPVRDTRRPIAVHAHLLGKLALVVVLLWSSP